MNQVNPDLRRDDLLYDLPDASIAQEAIEPRDAARLLDTRDMTDHVFRDLASMLEPGDLVVVNETKVRRARLRGTRVGTGGAVELLVLSPYGDDTWECLCRPARRLRAGVEIEFDGLGATIVGGPDDGRVRVRFALPDGASLERWFDTVGETPLPPYFVGEVDPDRYQTIFAEQVGSAAAPTAALHFTESVVSNCIQKGVEFTRVELHVGLDTFRPVAADRLADHVMHTERFRVSPDAAHAIQSTRERGGRVIAVGTTVARTLEAAAVGGTVTAMEGATDLFITPGYEFRAVDALITNFHVPGSTLIALIAAALGDRWRHVYRTAIDRGYRFLSFGDAMLIEVRGQSAEGRGTAGG